MRRLSKEQAARVERAAPRVARIAHSVHRMVSHVPVDDLESAGYEGLVQAALRYDPSLGVAFEAFAYYRIRGAMIDWARRNSPGTRTLQRAQRALAAQHAEFVEAGESDPQQQRSLRDRVTMARQLVARATAGALLARTAPTDPESLTARDTNPEASLIDEETRRQVNAAMGTLLDDDRRLLEGIYFHNQTMQQHAESIGVSTSTVSRRHGRALNRLAHKLGGA